LQLFFMTSMPLKKITVLENLTREATYFEEVFSKIESFSIVQKSSGLDQ
jgi:hypothetical protein